MSSRVLDLSGGPVESDLDVRWVHGAKGEPPIQVHRCDAHTFVMRQSKLVHAEAPFLYLLFGERRAILFDTGAAKAGPAHELRLVVDRIVDEWLAEHPRDRYELVVAHTHGHSDHVAGDDQFLGRDNTSVVGTQLEDVQAFFRIPRRPDGVAQFDLGGRVIEIIATPGHQAAAITIYDRWSGFLLTGDNAMPGRIFAPDFGAYLTSIERTVEFALDRAVTHVMGSHIEMTSAPGRDYPLAWPYQPDEPPLQMTVEQLKAIRDAARLVKDKPGAHRFDDFLIMNGPYRHYVPRLLIRAIVSRCWRHPFPLADTTSRGR